MKLSEVKQALPKLNQLVFALPDGTTVPEHFHVTEVGVIQKNFIDCGGTIRNETVVSFQLWSASDTDHRLKPKKLTDIITLSERLLDMGDFEVEVEYQGDDTISKFGLEFNGQSFVLQNKQTDCLAPDKCGIPAQKPRIKLSDLKNKPVTSCTPGSGCC